MHADDQHPSTDEAEATTGELARRCSLCLVPIAAQFFTLRGLLVCPDCASNMEKKHAVPGGRRRAAILGLIAAAVFAVLWFLTTRSTGQPLSVLAVLAGLVIGLAVQKGSGGRGGLRYQVIAALLVYGAFIVRYVPPIFGGIADSIKDQHGAKLVAQGTHDAPVAATPAATGQPASNGEATEKHVSTATPMSEQSSVSATLEAYFVFTLIAWCLNRRVHIKGPFAPSS